MKERGAKTLKRKRGVQRKAFITFTGTAAFRENVEMYSLLLPVLAVIFVFCYIPLYGVVIAFQNYAPGSAFVGPGVQWVGLQHFKTFIQSKYFTRILCNTLRLNLLNLAFGFWLPILFALLVNEIRARRFQKFVQTASYMPYFISTVVVAGMVISFIDTDGAVNQLLGLFRVPRQNYRLAPEAFDAVYTIVNVWKTFGFSSILYLSTITSIDPTLYEAARMDGAGRLRRIWHITLPGLKNIIAINLILAIGNIFAANTELILLLYLPATYETSDVIGTYVYRLGIEGGQFSYTAAVGLFMSVIGFALTFFANKASDRLTGYGLW